MRGLGSVGAAAVLVAGALASLEGHAQGSERLVAAAALAKSPQAYLGERIAMRDLYCYSDADHYECRTTAALRIRLANVPPGAAKTAMERTCSALDGVEQIGRCRFTLKLVPTAWSRRSGNYTRRGKLVTGPMIFVTAEVLSARRD